MSVDLDRFYAKLAEQSDSARIPTLQGVLDRAHQRRRRAIATTMSAVLVVAMFVGARVFLAPIPTTLPPVTPDPVSWVSFDGDAKPVYPFTSQNRTAYTISDDRRSYATWRAEDGEQFAGAIDLATGKALWEPLSLGKFGDSNGMEVSPKAILLLTEQGFENPLIQNGSDTIIAVSPDTGKIMWTLPYDFNDTSRILYEDTLVITWEAEGRTEGLDLLTGRPKWTVNEQVVDGGLHAMRTYQQFHVFRGWSGPPLPADRRVVLHLADGRIQIREVETGKVLSERSGVPIKPHPDWNAVREIVLGNNLYQVDQEGVLVSELTGSGQPKRIYAKPGFQMDTSIEPCGPQLICLVDIKNLDTGEIVALDGNGKEQWRRPAAGDASIMASDTGVILTSHLGATKVYDLSGNPLLPDELGKGRPMWVDSGNLLVMEPSGVTGFSVTTKQVTPLGRPAITGFCSWNTTMLTCPTEKGITVWRYAN